MTSDERVEWTGAFCGPVYSGGELVGLRLGGSVLPFPGLGLECELGGIAPGAGGRVQMPLSRLLRARRGLPAEPSRAWHRVATAMESERVFDELGCSYREGGRGGDHFEHNTWLHRSATGARANLEARLEEAARLVRDSESELVLHGLGGDGQGHSWSSLHVNVPISRRCYREVLGTQRAGELAYTWYLPAQATLSVVDGNGGVGEEGFLLSDRQGEFDRVFGSTTLRPQRAMLVDRSEGFGSARIMNMLRALSWGPGSAAGLFATQLDCLILELAVHGALIPPRIPIGDPVEAAWRWAARENLAEATEVQARAQGARREVVEALEADLGADCVERLLPGAAAHLDWIDATLEAARREDEAELAARCDWARKQEILDGFVGRRGRGWAAERDTLLLVNAHYARLDEEALRRRFEAAEVPSVEGLEAPQDTSSYLLHWLVERHRESPRWHDELEAASVTWAGVERVRGSWAQPVGGYWPWAERREARLRLAPWRFTRRSCGEALAGIRDLDDLFEAFGEQETIFADYAGRRFAVGNQEN